MTRHDTPGVRNGIQYWRVIGSDTACEYVKCFFPGQPIDRPGTMREDCHVHHKDRDPGNNHRSNLMLMHNACHSSLHWNEDQYKSDGNVLAWANPSVRARQLLAMNSQEAKEKRHLALQVRHGDLRPDVERQLDELGYVGVRRRTVEQLLDIRNAILAGNDLPHQHLGFGKINLDVDAMRAMRDTGATLDAIGRAFGVSVGTAYGRLKEVVI